MVGLADGLTIVCKRECDTCRMIVPVLAQLLADGQPLTIYSQDDPTFPVASAVYDETLETSFLLDIEIVPTLIRVENGRETARTVGWNRQEWERLSGVSDLGPGLMASKPGCGALNVMPGTAELLQIRVWIVS